MKTKIIAMVIIGFSAAILGSMALTPGVGYGSPATERATRDGAAAGAAAGRAAAVNDVPPECDTGGGAQSCGAPEDNPDCE